jgi:hypothetical protein
MRERLRCGWKHHAGAAAAAKQADAPTATGAGAATLASVVRPSAVDWWTAVQRAGRPGAQRSKAAALRGMLSCGAPLPGHLRSVLAAPCRRLLARLQAALRLPATGGLGVERAAMKEAEVGGEGQGAAMKAPAASEAQTGVRQFWALVCGDEHAGQVRATGSNSGWVGAAYRPREARSPRACVDATWNQRTASVEFCC